MAVQAENMCLENLMSFVPFDLCGTQNSWVMSGDESFLFQEMESFNQLRNENLVSSLLNDGRDYYGFSGDFAPSLYSDFDKQTLEIDGFLQLENQRLRNSILQEHAKQSAFLLQKLESRAKYLISLKDQELAVARARTIELQDLLNASQIEAKAWQRKALEKEAIAFELNNRLNQIKEKQCSEAVDEDTVSFCDSSSSSSGEKKKNKERDCKLCQTRKSCVVFFPCRHVCCCKSCESLLEQCLVCNTVKVDSLEVILD